MDPSPKITPDYNAVPDSGNTILLVGTGPEDTTVRPMRPELRRDLLRRLPPELRPRFADEEPPTGTPTPDAKP